MALYVLLTQAGWFACVLSGPHGAGWIGSGFALLVAALHLAWCSDKKSEGMLLIMVTGLGWSWETLMVMTDTLRYPGSSTVAPHWMAALWLLFAVQLNTLFRWLHGRWLVSAIMGAVAGPIAFRAGSLLGAVEFPVLATGMMALALGWLFLFPAMIWLAARHDGVFAVQRLSNK